MKAFIYCDLKVLYHGRTLVCDVHYTYVPGDRGVRYFPDGSGEPPTPPEIEICHVKMTAIVLKDGTVVSRDWLHAGGWIDVAEDAGWYALELNDAAYQTLCEYADA